MNPYAPPTVPMAASPEPSEVSLKNPARFLLYPLAALCILFFIAMEWHHWHNSFKFRIVDFLNAGAGALIGLFGFTALVLGSRKLSKNTRVLTMLWSVAGGSILVISMFFEPPASLQDFLLISLTGAILLLVAILAFRSVPQRSLPLNSNWQP